MAKKRYLTGDRPTGPLHIGHYVGSIKNRLDLQKQGNEGFVIIADYQVLTDRLETKDIEKNIIELVKDYLSLGIDPEKTTIFVQSQVPELAELTQIFSNLVTVPMIERNPTVKEEAAAAGINKMSLGLFSYPVSQAADILAFKPDFVPVGGDQAPHIELTREIAKRFNNKFGEVFPIPEIMLSKNPRLLGLDGTSKMSKSRGNAIFLSDDESTVTKKIKGATTDSETTIAFDPENRPEVSNLVTLFSIATLKDEKDIVDEFQGKGYANFKVELARVVNDFLDPIRSKREKISDKDVIKVLEDGTKKARESAKNTVKEVKGALSLDYKNIF